MTTLTKGPALGDIVLYESPRAICREEYEVTRVLAATRAYEVGTPMDFDAAVAAVQTIAMVTASASGSYRLGFRGLWTAPIAWNAVLATIKTAFELISGGVTVTFSGALINATTITFANTVGNIPEIVVDPGLLLTAGGVEAPAVITTTTVGELATMKMIAATAAAADAILLERVSLTDLQNAGGEALRRSFIMRGLCVVNATKIRDEGIKHTATFGTAVALQTALVALGINARLEPLTTNEGTPSS